MTDAVLDETTEKVWETKDISDLDVCIAYNLIWLRQLEDEAYSVNVLKPLMAMYPGCPAKVLEAACSRAYRRGLIDYGVSITYGWLTEQGLHFLDEMRNPPGFDGAPTISRKEVAARLSTLRWL